MRMYGVAWPFQTAAITLSRGSNPGNAVTTRSLCAGFHALNGVFRCPRLGQEGRKNVRYSRGGAKSSSAYNGGPRRMIVRCLNRIMLEPSEVMRGEDGRLYAKLGAADSRTHHVRSVLKALDGEPVRVGVVDRGLIDDAMINWKEPDELPEGTPPSDVPGRKEDRKAASGWRDLVLELGTSEQLLDQVPPERRPKVALMLALPRPLQLERILPMVSSLGVTTLVLCHASKVEKMYFGSHLFRDPHCMREKLVEGLSQSGDTVLPKVIVARRLKVFLEDDLDRLFPRERWVRTVAHPTRLEAGQAHALACGTELSPRGVRFSELKPPEGCDPADAGILVTVGPEGGWVEPNELELLQSFGFQAVTLGKRVLRSDVAVCALLSLAHAWVEERARECTPTLLKSYGQEGYSIRPKYGCE
ncbi:unnamed protein product [Ascophyllum nodosum]